METTCEHCKAKLNIPDEKIPKNKTVKIACPKCKKKITLSAKKKQQKLYLYSLIYVFSLHFTTVTFTEKSTKFSTFQSILEKLNIQNKAFAFPFFISY